MTSKRWRRAEQAVRKRWPELPAGLMRKLARILATATTDRLQKLAVIGYDDPRPVIAFDAEDPIGVRALYLAGLKRLPVIRGHEIAAQIFPQETA